MKTSCVLLVCGSATRLRIISDRDNAVTKAVPASPLPYSDINKLLRMPGLSSEYSKIFKLILEASWEYVRVVLSSILVKAHDRVPRGRLSDVPGTHQSLLRAVKSLY